MPKATYEFALQDVAEPLTGRTGRDHVAGSRVPPEIEWHINFDDDVSELDAAYIDALIRLAGRRLKIKPVSILDAPCGNGRLHAYLRAYGYDVYGVDSNRELIGQAKAKHRASQDRYYVGDIRDFDLGRRFDVYLSWFTSLGYFDDNGNIMVMKNAAKHLNKNGIMIVDVANGEANIAYQASNPNAVFYNESGRYVMVERPTLRFVNGVPYQQRDETFYEKRRRNLFFIKKHGLKMLRLYSETDLRNQLAKAGFDTIYSLSGRSFAKFRRDARRIVAVGVKK